MCLSFHEDDHNCFSFCLQFLNSVLAVEGRRPLSRETLTHSFILPRMTRVSKYITLYRHIERQQYFLVDRQAEDSQAKDRQEGQQLEDRPTED